MYAIFEAGGKQYRVSPGDTVRVERMEGPIGHLVEFGQVLMVQGEEGPRFGQPHVRGAKVVARIVEQHRRRKIRVFKMKRRQGYRKTIGHRQWYTGLKIQEIRV